MGLKKTLKKLLGYKETDKFLNESYSQEGEDNILNRVFENKPNGFFIDVGAHHPMRFSNTYIFYKKGWRGINIDAMPGSMELFKKYRPLDINLEIPVAGKEAILPFHIFNELALNTFSPELAAEREQKEAYKIVKILEVQTKTLASILNDHLPPDTKINFISIDAEGFDFDILTSNNWKKFPAEMVLVESELTVDAFFESKLCAFMQGMGYHFFAKTLRTYFLKNDTFTV
ncbi:MAG: FkbM family methyltransferase [Mucilaginibacter sp.]